MPDLSNVEHIIMNSVVKSDITARLAEVPLDDKLELLTLLGGAIKVMFHEERFNGEWLLVALTGYVGKEECSGGLRTIWKREFLTPLPPIAKVRDADGFTEDFTISIDNMVYKFSKVGAVYLGCAPAPSTAQSL